MFDYLKDVTFAFVKRIKNNPHQNHSLEVLNLFLIYSKCNLLDSLCANTGHHCLCVLLRSLCFDELSFKAVNSEILSHYKKDVANLLWYVINAVTKLDSPLQEWIFAVPLFHYVSESPDTLQINFSESANAFTKFQRICTGR